MAALSVGWAGKRCVEIYPGYREPLMLYVVIAAPSGERKSAVFDLLAAPIRGAAGPLGAELLVDDATPEALELLMAQGGGKAAVFGPEGGAFLDCLAARQRGAGSALYLKGHTGESHVTRRVGRGGQRIEHPALTIGVMTQPSVLRGLLDREELLNRGFFGRILFSCPASRSAGGLQPRMAPLPAALVSAYRQTLGVALALPLPAQVPALVFSAEAQEEYDRFFTRIEERRQPGGDLAPLSEWAPKLRGNVMRVAGLLHLSEVGEGDAPVSAEVVRRAALLGEYLISHARAAFALMSEDGAAARARKLLGWLREGRRARFTAREAHRFLAKTGTRKKVLDPALQVLLSHGFIRGGRRGISEVYEVNPHEMLTWPGFPGG